MPNGRQSTLFDPAITGLLAEPHNVAAMQEIVDMAIAHTRQVFMFGSMSEKTRIATSLIALGAKNTAQARQSEAERQMRDEYAELRLAIQGSVVRPAHEDEVAIADDTLEPAPSPVDDQPYTARRGKITRLAG